MFSEKTSILSNASYLFINNIISLLSPIVVLPYLIQTLGADTYGVLSYSQAIVGYVVLLVDFGFNLAGIRFISNHRRNSELISKYFTATTIIKSVLFLTGTILMFLILNSLQVSVRILLLCSAYMYLALINIVFPHWYYQGVEKMWVIPFVSIIIKVVSISSYFLLIVESSDYALHPLIGFFSNLVALLLLRLFFGKERDLRLTMPSRKLFFWIIRDSWRLFVSNISIKIYLSSMRVIIGSTLGMSQVSLYEAYEKLIAIFKIPWAVISQAMFPSSPTKFDQKYILNTTWFSLLFNAILFCILLWIAPFVINYILGTEVNVDSLWILGLTVIFVGVSNVFGILCLVRTSNEILFTKSVVIGSFVFVCLCLFFGLRGDFSLRNIFTVVALTELSVLAMTTYFVLRLKNDSSGLSRLQ